MPEPLLTGERLIRATRQHWSVAAPGVVAAVLAAAVGLALVRLVPESARSQSLDQVRLAATLGVLVAGALVVTVRVLQWRCARYLLTDRRIIVTRGVLSRFTESITLDRIQNTILHQSIGARMFGWGDVEIESAGRDGTELLHRIPAAQDFDNALMEAIEAHRAGLSRPGPGI